MMRFTAPKLRQAPLDSLINKLSGMSIKKFGCQAKGKTERSFVSVNHKNETNKRQKENAKPNKRDLLNKDKRVSLIVILSIFIGLYSASLPNFINHKSKKGSYILLETSAAIS